MIGTIIGAIVVGLIIGVLARLVLPGKQNISVVMTIIIGIVASLVASLICYKLFNYHGNGGIRWIPLIVGVIVAMIGITAYGNVTGRRQVR